MGSKASPDFREYQAKMDHQELHQYQREQSTQGGVNLLAPTVQHSSMKVRVRFPSALQHQW